MDDSEIWRAVHRERAALADLLGTLTDAQWQHPSLCSGWTVRDVAAHVISSADARAGELLIAMLRARGNFNGAMLRIAKQRSARPTQEIIADYRRLDGSRRHPPGTTTFDPLVDVLVHTQDITRPLGISYPMPAALAAAAGTYVWSRGFPYSPRKRLGEFRFTATDIAWEVGEGQTVGGPMAAILLLLTGRAAGVGELTGDGATALPV